jgi:hypothetical protein
MQKKRKKKHESKNAHPTAERQLTIPQKKKKSEEKRSEARRKPEGHQ